MRLNSMLCLCWIRRVIDLIAEPRLYLSILNSTPGIVLHSRMANLIFSSFLAGATALLVSCTHLSDDSMTATLSLAPEALVADSSRIGSALASSSPFKSVLREVTMAIANGATKDQANYVSLLENGEDALIARLHLIRQATRSIDFQTFIWANDEVGSLLARELISAARRGVKVKVLVDYVGIAKDAKALALVSKAHPNLEVRVYRPTARTLEYGQLGTLFYALTNFKGANQRMHNKVLVVDDTVGITGGRNVENSYFNHAVSMNFKDRDVLLVGPVAADMTHTFDDFWNYRHSMPANLLTDVANAKPEHRIESLATPIDRSLHRLSQRAGQPSVVKAALVEPLRRVQSVQFISDLPGKNGAVLLTGGGRATAHILSVLDEAREQIWMQSPYLVLGKPGQRYFRKLRKSKPSLQIHVSTNSFGSTDNLIAYAGNVRLRDCYVHQLGFQIGEYRPLPSDLARVLPNYDWLANIAKSARERDTFMCIHAKSFQIDEELSFVGSFNLDPRSAHLNTESGLLIRDRDFANLLRQEIRRDLDSGNSWTIAGRTMPDSLIDLQMLTQEVTQHSPINVAPLDATSAFELKPGATSVPRNHPEFYQRYRDIGSFPGGDGILGERELKGRVLRFSTPIIDPLL